MVQVDRPDALIVGAPVLTVDACRRWADGIALRDGRVAAVGSEAEVRELAGPGTRVIELSGGMVLPGFQDSHVHPLHGGLARLRCDLHEVSGREGYLRAIQAYADRNPHTEWIVGSGWSMAAFPGGTPERGELDRVVADRPAFFVNQDGHGAWVNSRALELAGVDAGTPDPRDGRIERDASGGPAGTLHEGAMKLVGDLVPTPGPEELTRALLDAQRTLHGLGITAWNDAWIEADDLQAYRSLAVSGQLTARVVLSLLWDRHRGEEQIDDLLEARERGTVGRVRALDTKIFQDGVAENFTAALLDPYLDASGSPTGNAGLSMIDPESLRRYVTLLDAAGFQVHFHAIGDRAVRECLDAVAGANEANARRDARHHIAHIQLIDPGDIPRFRALGVVANGQPVWACNEPQMRDLTTPFLGTQRSQLQYPFASLRRAGAPIAFGSDWPVSTPDPLLEIEVAVTRIPPDERHLEPFIPNERVDLPTALDAFTIGAAYVNHLDDDTGSLEVGKLADIAVLDRNLFDLDGANISDADVVLTLVEGEPVYDERGLFA